MSLGVFDTQLGAQGMEGIGELQNYLAPLLLQCGPYHVLVLIVGNRVIFVITEISSTHGYKNSASSNSNEVIHGPELIPQHSKKVKNYTK
jgi:hypothetical protein